MRPDQGSAANVLRGATWPYAVSAVASGSASLVFEVLWFYQARLAFGNALWATSVVLAGFMAGLGIGGLLAARRADRVRNPGSVYLALEVVIAVMGVALLLLTLAALPMGATLPVMMRVATLERARFGSTLSLLYGANTVGAVCGVLLAEWPLIGAFGIRGTAFFAAGSGLAAGGLVWFGGLVHALAKSRTMPRTMPTARRPPRRLPVSSLVSLGCCLPQRAQGLSYAP